MTPNRIKDFIPADSAARMPCEQGKHVKCLRLERHDFASHE